ncbi:hypothetical protein MTR67_022602 [Solanum verrucosum]|uniref:RING-type domain-containing protein n=1 Tax=Solanum verrucosum TaxID=315347 RepID=A0AAF0QS36_SOLVR|nr:hypothetical protein MTR67_022602 [Solanum verrucosum]
MIVFSDHNGGESVICSEDYVDKDSLCILPCEHVYHHDNISGWWSIGVNQCPKCHHDYYSLASMRGHIELVKFILSRNLLLPAELDVRKSSALHVASIKGYVEFVKKLLVVNLEMCLTHDCEGRNHLHLAVIKGRVAVIKELVQASYLAALQTIDRDENVLHLCVKNNNQLETLNLLVEIYVYNRKEYNGDKG